MMLRRSDRVRVIELALIACVWSGAGVAATPPATAASAPAPYSEGRLWRIAKPGIPDSFVFGTIHVADPRVASIPEPVAQAMTRVRLLAMEMAPAELADSRIGDLELLDDGGRL